jgi:trk system potassium uptake protein TrkA
VKQRGEYLVVGLGRFGFSLALKLHELGHRVLGIDSDAQLVQEAAGQLPDTVCLDATEEAALREVGAEYFQTAVVAIGDSFENSVLATSLLKELGIPQVLCKALTRRQQQILLKVGADAVVLPEHDAGVRLATELSSKGRVLERLELEPGLSVSEVTCPARLHGRTLVQLDLRRRLGLTVVAIKGQRNCTLPGPDEQLKSGDVLVVIGRDSDIAALESWEP